jgi:hypothetical protein
MFKHLLQACDLVHREFVLVCDSEVLPYSHSLLDAASSTSTLFDDPPRRLDTLLKNDVMTAPVAAILSTGQSRKFG